MSSLSQRPKRQAHFTRVKKGSLPYGKQKFADTDSEPEMVENEEAGRGDIVAGRDDACSSEGDEDRGDGRGEANDGPDNASDEEEDERRQIPMTQEVPVLPGQSIKIVLASPVDGKPVPKKEHPQIRVNKFWSNFEPEYEGGVTQILPDSLIEASRKNAKVEKETTTSAIHSYKASRNQCLRSVKRIIRECRALNQKYTDPHFDLERDLRITGDRDCIDGLLLKASPESGPQDVKRVTDIFEHPQFYKDGAGYDDIVQGQLGDCWLLAALSALTANQKLLRRVCVIQDQEVGVYGFVFYRDGEWQPCIIDDKLYLRAPSFEESGDVVLSSYNIQHTDQEQRYKETFQTGSKSLFYSSCRDQNETWVPLLEKALAKAHGDYCSLNGGETGEALEDLTGGVTTEIYTQNILSKDRFWKDNLSRIGKDFLFSCATAFWVNWKNNIDDEQRSRREQRRQGVVSGHAYAVLDTYEGFGKRLVKIRNPWGQREWSGAWSDGSKEWTAEWVQRLNHKFGDDGIFWISYEDMLKKYKYMDRTRIFGAEWHHFQKWTRVQVPWNTRDYLQTKFTFTLPKDSETVIVLSQLDDRYFYGLQGQYNFKLQFRIHEEDDEDEVIARSKINYSLERSTNLELFLEKGTYTVLFKLEAERTARIDIETMIRQNIASRKEKVTQVATLYDLAHAKGKPAKKEKKPISEEDKKKETSGEEAKPAISTELDTSKPAVEPSQQQQQQEGEKKPTDSEAAKPAPEAENPTTGDTKGPSDDTEPSTIIMTTTTTTTTATPTSPQPQSDLTCPPKSLDDLKPKDSPPQNYTPDEDDPDRNPWNAFCVVGLRVYTKCTDVDVRVLLPEEERPPVLDRDDIARAALKEAETQIALEKKKKHADDDDDDEDEEEEEDSDDEQEGNGNDGKVGGASPSTSSEGTSEESSIE